MWKFPQKTILTLLLVECLWSPVHLAHVDYWLQQRSNGTAAHNYPTFPRNQVPTTRNPYSNWNAPQHVNQGWNSHNNRTFAQINPRQGNNTGIYTQPRSSWAAGPTMPSNSYPNPSFRNNNRTQFVAPTPNWGRQPSTYGNTTRPGYYNAKNLGPSWNRTQLPPQNPNLGHRGLSSSTHPGNPWSAANPNPSANTNRMGWLPPSNNARFSPTPANARNPLPGQSNPMATNNYYNSSYFGWKTPTGQFDSNTNNRNPMAPATNTSFGSNPQQHQQGMQTWGGIQPFGSNATRNSPTPSTLNGPNYQPAAGGGWASQEYAGPAQKFDGPSGNRWDARNAANEPSNRPGGVPLAPLSSDSNPQWNSPGSLSYGGGPSPQANQNQPKPNGNTNPYANLFI